MNRRDFIAGGVTATLLPILAKPTRGILGSGKNNAVMLARPYDAEVEYLESTGTQWILLPSAYSIWDIGLKPKGVATPPYRRFYAGCMNRGSRTASCYATSNSALEFQNYNRGVLTVPCDLYTWHIISVKSDMVIVDGAEFSFHVGTAAYGSYIFGCYYTSNEGVACQISYYRAYDNNGNVTLDLIPVRFTNELGVSEGAMYDRVSGQLFRNQGTGSFVIGPDKVK